MSIEHGVYVKLPNFVNLLRMCICVYGQLITRSDLIEKEHFKTLFTSEFEMKNLGKLKYFSGMEVVENCKGIVFRQQKYATEILRKFNIEDCNGQVQQR